MLRNRLLTRFAAVIVLALAAGCNFAFDGEAATDNVDRVILGGGGAAVMMNVDGQSAMLDGKCVRSAGPSLKAMKEEGSTVAQMRSALRASCSTTAQQASNSNLARPVRGRLFAPMKHSDGSSRAYGHGSASYYAWYLDPSVYWSPVVNDNRRFCRGLFGWDDTTCFNLLNSFTSYGSYRPYCWRNCFADVYTAQATTGTIPTPTPTSTSSTSSFAANKCVQYGCYGQWWWSY